MQEYASVVYLDVQKTGSTFVNSFLRQFMREPPVTMDRHRPPAQYDPQKFYFITCRDPLDTYLSLYSFGCQGEGQLRQNLGSEMYDGTAHGFSSWLRFLLGGENLDFSKEMRYYISSGIAPFAGVQTFRLLRLSFVSPFDVLAECRSRDDLLRAFDTKRLWTEALHTECLNAELVSLVTRILAPHMSDPDAALRYLAKSVPRNPSERIDKRPGFSVHEEDLRLLEEREWLFYERLGFPRYSAANTPVATTAA